MSKYTTEVRYICEHYAGLDESTGFENVNEIVEMARPKIFDFDYPIFDESYRSVLETKILKHFYTREIGAETVGLWKMWLDTRLNEIMPYYNQLYKSTLISFNPMWDTDITTEKQGDVSGEKTDELKTNETNNRTIHNELHGESSGSSTDNGTNNDNDWDYYSDTPQGGINGLESNTYLTNARHDTRSNATHNEGSTTNETDTENDGTDNLVRNKKDNNTSEFTNTESWVEHITGKRGTLSYSKMLQEFRDTFLNIDVTVIANLSDLFMGLW